MTPKKRMLIDTTVDAETRRDIGEHIVAIMDAVEEGDFAGMISAYWDRDGNVSVFTCGHKNHIELVVEQMVKRIPENLERAEAEG